MKTMTAKIFTVELMLITEGDTWVRQKDDERQIAEIIKVSKTFKRC